MKNIRLKKFVAIFLVISTLVLLGNNSVFAAVDAATIKKDIDAASSSVLKCEKTVEVTGFDATAAQYQLNDALKLVEKIKNYGKAYNTTYKDLYTRLTIVSLKIEIRTLENSVEFYKNLALKTSANKSTEQASDAPKSDNQKSNTGNTQVSDNTCGNSSGNLKNFGIAAISNGWIYYRNNAMLGNLYKVKEDGSSDAIKLNDDNVAFINVVGNYVYYVDGGFNGGKIYRIDTDGKNRELLSNPKSKARSTYMQVIGNNIYYIDKLSSGFGNLYRMNSDGSKSKDLNVGGDAFVIADNKIYITNDWMNTNNYSSITKLDLDGSHKEYTSIDVMRASFDVSNNYIYMSRANYLTWMLGTTSSFGNLIKKSLTNDSNTVLSSEICSHINVSGDWVYYETMQGLYRVKTDGSASNAVYTGTNYIGFAYCVVGNYVYLIDSNTNKEYRVNTDGTSKQEIG
jgi:hypothetical protein